jgi:hypothetical protein
MKPLRLKRIIENVSKSELDDVERFAEKELDPIDVDFTKHFFDRAIDPRNIKAITKDELMLFFKGLSKYKNKFFDFIEKYTEFVVTHKKYMINIPFVRMANKLVAKTIMRKPNFMTSNPKLQFENKEEYQKFYEYIQR